MKAYVTEMWGKADDYNVVFHKEGDLWETIVPPDLSDGKYVVDITARTNIGILIYYKGILYMADGRLVCLNLLPDQIDVKLLERCSCYDGQ